MNLLMMLILHLIEWDANRPFKISKNPNLADSPEL